VDLLKKKEKDKKDKKIIEKKIEKEREREEKERERGESKREIRRKYIKIPCAQSNIDILAFFCLSNLIVARQYSQRPDVQQVYRRCKYRSDLVCVR